MADIGWRENRPRNKDKVHSIGTEWQSMLTTIESAVSQHYQWTENSGTSAGESRFSTVVPGSARGYYGTQSQVSNPGRIGSFMITSDTTRLVAFSSTDTMFIGSNKMVLSMQSSAVNNHRATTQQTKQIIVAEAGKLAGTAAEGSKQKVGKLIFPVIFGAKPVVVLCVGDSGVDSETSAWQLSLATNYTSSELSVYANYLGPGSTPSSCFFNYISIGTQAV